ncbi:MAG: phage tail protein [Planctomycetes bacterium]|nr:phage tail protein [Planctomycetota bacterium]
MIFRIDRKTLGALLIAGCLLAGPNRRPHDHIGNFTFVLTIGGEPVGRFRTVDGLEKEIESIDFREAGETIVRKLPGQRIFHRPRLLAGAMNREVLAGWRGAVLAGEEFRRDVSLVLAGDDGQPIATYLLMRAWPCKWKGWDLDGKGGDILVEEIELAVEEIQRVR